MILMLGEVPGVSVEHLLARPDKSGRPGVRGPLGPLTDLREGDKLHIAGVSDGSRVAGYDPDALVDRLRELGWDPAVRLRQIHLIADWTGRDGAVSFATRLAAALAGAGFDLDEIKAPLGRVRCDSRGKIRVCLGEAQQWTPSSPALNLYVGPRVPAKHRQVRPPGSSL